MLILRGRATGRVKAGRETHRWAPPRRGTRTRKSIACTCATWKRQSSTTCMYASCHVAVDQVVGGGRHVSSVVTCSLVTSHDDRRRGCEGREP